MQFFRTLFGKGIEYNRNSIGNLNYFVMKITETRFFATAVASLAALLFSFQICAGASAGREGTICLPVIVCAFGSTDSTSISMKGTVRFNRTRFRS